MSRVKGDAEIRDHAVHVTPASSRLHDQTTPTFAIRATSWIQLHGYNPRLNPDNAALPIRTPNSSTTPKHTSRSTRRGRCSHSSTRKSVLRAEQLHRPISEFHQGVGSAASRSCAWSAARLLRGSTATGLRAHVPDRCLVSLWRWFVASPISSVWILWGRRSNRHRIHPR